MLQFTKQQIAHFYHKLRQDDSILHWLLEQTQLVRENPLQIPTHGIANWSLYYYCSKCSVELTYDFHKPHTHICPSCGQNHTGEPFDGAWWRHTHEHNYNAAYYCGLLYLCTQEACYAQTTKEILLTYATYYPGYEVHGDIPYNGPGKANAQTLCEAIFIRTLATAYDLVADTMTTAERELVCRDLLRCGAQFLREHRHNQLHNHEVIINAAIGVVGLILEDDALIHFAVYEPYGLIYQLEKGMLADGIWFECSLGYHFYALQNFYGYERFAVHTKHSQIQHPNYQKMLHAAVQFLKPDYTFPMINDTMEHHTQLDAYNLFEFSYQQFGSSELLQLLHKVYETRPRGDVESFFYGVDKLPPAPPITLCDYHDAEGSGTTIVRGSHDQYLMFRHGPFGGEHDHYDRLALSYFYGGERISADVGTTGYGAHYHYAYFKNTGTHNTVVIDEENHAPSAAKILAFDKTDEATYLDAKVTWNDDYVMPDSFTICQWSNEVYQGVTMRRQIYKADDYLIDLFTVDRVQDKTIDWVMHFGGQRSLSPACTCIKGALSEKKPFCYLSDVCQVQENGDTLHTVYTGEQVETHVYTLLENSHLVYAEGPGKPTTTKEAYMLQRARGVSARFFNVICCNLKGARTVRQVTLHKNHDRIIIRVETVAGIKEHSFAL